MHRTYEHAFECLNIKLLICLVEYHEFGCLLKMFLPLVMYA